ncbi:MAG: AbrB/MazE/SpoVT family DNA-binding domain-containing protein [Thermoplasmata archaeon]
MKIGEMLDETDVEDIPQLIEVIRKNIESTLNEFITSRAFFKAKVGESGRITIPTAEREVLDINEGDIVQVIVRPIEDR